MAQEAGLPSQTQLSLPTLPFKLSHLRTHLVALHPDNEPFRLALESSQWSVDEEMIPRGEEDKFELNGGEVVCPIPPVSGG
ncbi:BZ3500_MvSof-1268-A1-R1_Chr11-3g03546 [Microbotryum saponariae]|uniref:BZ3500_MvSof-1268-A1-R1_Chr11-3g03546 protein n=1 Tax=Microbotryum saponariae TaxID=289078 RepID=A0A2X0KTF6_9BASI|nr:BZ3500_MvSof-1268-A1-R1_Chr11-3g03546 [Microbotryum saponariae]SDA03555.1 BZ3501_MvSof-1269-A2-R1_Chr11g03123 [Microbotryum saponariae]